MTGIGGSRGPGERGEPVASPKLPSVSGPCYIGAGRSDRWAVVQLAARQVLALVVLVRVQAAQLPMFLLVSESFGTYSAPGW